MTTQISPDIEVERKSRVRGKGSPAGGAGATLQQLADAVGVSAVTVSNVLRGKRNHSVHRDAILRAAREFNFVPNPHAQRLATGKSSNTVSLFSRTFDGPMTRKLMIIQNLLIASGYEVPLYVCGGSLGESEQVQVEMLRDVCSHRPRALLSNTDGMYPATLAELRTYQEQGGLVVTYDDPCEGILNQVIFDREHNTYLAVKHLVDLGHRKIGLYLPHPPIPPDHPRILGCKRALAEADLSLNPDWLYEHGQYEVGGMWLAETFLSQTDRPTGIAIVNDLAAMAFVAEIVRGGVRVPEDLSVVSHDDLPIAQFGVVPLTAVTNPTQQIAEAVVGLVQDRLSDVSDSPSPAQPKSVVLRGDLAVRKSAKAVLGAEI